MMKMVMILSRSRLMYLARIYNRPDIVKWYNKRIDERTLNGKILYDYMGPDKSHNDGYFPRRGGFRDC